MRIQPTATLTVGKDIADFKAKEVPRSSLQALDIALRKVREGSGSCAVSGSNSSRGTGTCSEVVRPLDSARAGDVKGGRASMCESCSAQALGA